MTPQENRIAAQVTADCPYCGKRTVQTVLHSIDESSYSCPCGAKRRILYDKEGKRVAEQSVAKKTIWLDKKLGRPRKGEERE